MVKLTLKTKARFLSDSSLLPQTSWCFHWSFAMFPLRVHSFSTMGFWSNHGLPQFWSYADEEKP